MWNHPEVLHQHLSKIDEPTAETILSYEARMGKAALMKNSLRKIEGMSEAIGPRESLTVETALAEKMYKHKVASWSCFQINSLPCEVLQEIFRYVVHSVEDTHRVVKHRLRISAVCKYWRKAALDDMSLWNTIYFDDNPSWPLPLMFFERAGTTKLDIRIDEPRLRVERKAPAGQVPASLPPSLTPDQMDALLDIVLSKYSQIRLIILVVDRWDTARTVLRRFSAAGESKTLGRFELHRGSSANDVIAWRPNADEMREVLNPYVLFDSTPNLAWLGLSGINIDWTKLNSASLTTLDLRRLSQALLPDGPTFRKILASSPNLYRLCLAQAGPQLDPSDRDFSPVDLPALRELVISDGTTIFTTHVLGQFTAPNLVCLTLVNQKCTEHGEIYTFLRGRYPKIEVLSMYTARIDEDPPSIKVALIRWLDSLPNLTVVKFAQVPALFIDAFIEDPRKYDDEPAEPDAEDSPDSHIIAPRLQSIQCTHLSKEFILRFIHNRKSIDRPVKRVYLPVTFAVTGLGRHALPEIVNAGVEVKILHHYMTTDEERWLSKLGSRRVD
ncbi:hypothetical protein BDW22DRAFT_20010 [Trametopsis cervina]|nr:hypothetical protein BDW22DRAFT_20010 [Trametopsis cervina]